MKIFKVLGMTLVLASFASCSSTVQNLNRSDLNKLTQIETTGAVAAINERKRRQPI